MNNDTKDKKSFSLLKGTPLDYEPQTINRFCVEFSGSEEYDLGLHVLSFSLGRQDVEYNILRDTEMTLLETKSMEVTKALQKWATNREHKQVDFILVDSTGVETGRWILYNVRLVEVNNGWFYYDANDLHRIHVKLHATSFEYVSNDNPGLEGFLRDFDTEMSKAELEFNKPDFDKLIQHKPSKMNEELKFFTEVTEKLLGCFKTGKR